MCGVGGILSHSACDMARALNAINRKQSHRGPDGSGIWQDASGRVGLAHTRLSILDLSDAGKQPMVDEASSLVLSVNGEIYNHENLRPEISGSRATQDFLSSCDVEVILRGYRKFGTKIFEKLNGMFAGAIVDEKSNQVILFRDRVGIKPLYYTFFEGRFVFASEIKGLFAALSVKSWQIDDVGLQQFLSFQTALGSRTLFKGISILEPGQLCVVPIDNPAAYRISNFSKTEYAPRYGRTRQQLSREFSDIFARSVSRHLLADVDVASYASAGLDSSSVANEAAKKLGKLNTFTGCFADAPPWYDETSVASELAATWGGQAHKVEISHMDFVDHFDNLVNVLDEPKMGMGAFSQYMVAKHVAENYKVVLTGHGGDELFSGYPVFQHPLQALLTGTNIPHAVYFLLAAIRKYHNHEYGFHLPLLWARHSRAKLLGKTSDDAATVFEPLISPKNGRFEQIFHAYFRNYLPNLLVVEDKISMAHSLESRTPLLDTELVDFALSIPEKDKTAGGQLKKIIFDHAREHLPRPFLSQAKRGFPTPLRLWLRGPLRGFLIERITSFDSGLAQLMDGNYLKKCTSHYLASPVQYSRPLDEIATHRIWQLLLLDSWLRSWKSNHGIDLFR